MVDRSRRAPFAAALATLPPAVPGAPCRIAELARVAILGIAARRDSAEALARAIATEIGVALPVRGASLGTTIIVGTGPAAWLVIAEVPPPDWAERLAAALLPHAMTVDQSDGYALLRMCGPAAEAVLQHGIFLDLDVVAFPPGLAAVTMAAHIGVIVWREATDRFCVGVARSYAGSAWHWLETAAASAGVALCAGDA